MKKYHSFFRLYIVNSLQYRAAAFAGIVTQFSWGFLQILMYTAFYKSNPSAFPMGLSQLSSYFWLQQAFMALFMTWFLDKDILDSISSGGVAYELCRPLDLYNMWYVKSMANRFSKAILRCLPILFAAFLLPEPYALTFPPDALLALSFGISFIAGFLIVVAFSMLIYVITFFTLSPIGIRIVALSLMEFLSGGIIPLPFLPDKIRLIVELLPFASMQNMPYRIYSGNITGMQAVYGIQLQLFWLLTLVMLGKFLMNKALKQTVIQGG